MAVAYTLHRWDSQEGQEQIWGDALTKAIFFGHLGKGAGLASGRVSLKNYPAYLAGEPHLFSFKPMDTASSQRNKESHLNQKLHWCLFLRESS